MLNGGEKYRIAGKFLILKIREKCKIEKDEIVEGLC